MTGPWAGQKAAVERVREQVAQGRGISAEDAAKLLAEHDLHLSLVDRLGAMYVALSNHEASWRSKLSTWQDLHLPGRMWDEKARELLDSKPAVVQGLFRVALARALHGADCGCPDFGDPVTDEDSRYIRAVDAALAALIGSDLSNE